MNSLKAYTWAFALVVAASFGQSSIAQDIIPQTAGCDAAISGACGVGCDSGCSECGSCADGCDSNGCCDRGCSTGRCRRCRGFRVLRSRCPDCEGYCELTIEMGEEERSCYKVEQKEICVPAITFPWQKCCGPVKCGKAKTVKVLKKHKFKCPKCECKWEVVDPQPCCVDAGVIDGASAAVPNYGAPVTNVQVRQSGVPSVPGGYGQPLEYGQPIAPPIIPVRGSIQPSGR